MSEEKKKLTISGVLADLEAGLERKQIKEKYGLSHNDMKALFSNPKLKGKKAKKEFEPSFELEDDVPDEPKRIAKAKKVKPEGNVVGETATQTTTATAVVAETAPAEEEKEEVSPQQVTQEVKGEPIREVKTDADNDPPTVTTGLW
jgi:hypothetical protein